MPPVTRILFVCLHGSAKSVIAVEQLRSLAGRRGLEVEATSAGIEPDEEIPPRLASALLEEGIDVRGRRPVEVTAEAIRSADHVVSFGCDLSDVAPEGTTVTYWADMPAVSDGYAVARAAIIERVTALLDELTAGHR